MKIILLKEDHKNESKRLLTSMPGFTSFDKIKPVKNHIPQLNI